MENSELTFQQAQDLSLTVEWKISFCESGESCWCRIIEPKEQIVDKDGDEIYIAGSGAIPKVYAEHLVKLHNSLLK